MPIKRFPLLGSINRRGLVTSSTGVPVTKDQRYIRVLPRLVKNSVTQTATIYMEKWPGWSKTTHGTGATAMGYVHAPTYNVAGFGANPSNLYQSAASIYYGSTLAGTVTGTSPFVMGVTEHIISEEFYYLITIRSVLSGTSAYYLPKSATSVSTTFTGDRTAGSPIVVNVSSTSGLYIGQNISATGFSGARILTIDSATQVTMTVNASSGAGTNTTFTREHLAKIIDADFPSNIRGPFVVIDGVTYIITSSGRIYSAAVNSITSWAAQDYLTANLKPDEGCFLARQRDYLVAFGRQSIQWYENAGNPAGSPLLRLKNTISEVGASFYQHCLIQDKIFFFGGGNDNSGVWVLAGGEPKRISTPAVDAVIATIGVGFTTRIQSFAFDGKTFVYISDVYNPVAETTQVLYCVELDLWIEPNFPPALNLSQSNSGVLAVSYNATTDVVFTLTASAPQSYQDYSNSLGYLAPYTMTIQTFRMLESNKRKFFKRIALIADTQRSGNHLLLPGTAGNYASTPDAAALDITGDIDIRAYIAPDDWTPAANISICSKWLSGADLSFQFLIIAGGLFTLQTTTSGAIGTAVTSASTVGTGATDGTALWVRVTLDVNNGAGGNTATFYTSTDYDADDLAGTWTQLGAAVVNAGVTSIFSGSAAFEIGSTQVGSADNFDGKIYRVQVYSGISGTLATDFNPSIPVAGSTSFVDSTGKTYTINGTASLVEDETVSYSNAKVSFNYDDYHPDKWSDVRKIPMNKNKKELPRCGSGYHLIAKIEHEDNTPFRAEAIEIEYDEAPH